MIKCVCSYEDCPIEITFDACSRAMFFTGKGGEENLMYLDENTIAELISELNRVFNSMVFKEDK